MGKPKGTRGGQVRLCAQHLLYRCPVSVTTYLVALQDRGQVRVNIEDSIRHYSLTQPGSCYNSEDCGEKFLESSMFVQLPCHGNCDKGCEVITTQ